MIAHGRPVRALALAFLVWGTSSRASTQAPVQWTLAVAEGAHVAAGRSFEATLDARIEPGWHLYAATQPPGGPQPLVVAVSAGSPYTMAGSVIGPLPRTNFDTNFNLETLFHDDAATLVVPLSVTTASTGPAPLALDVSYQTCNDRYCLPPAVERLSLALPIGRPLERGVTTAGRESSAGGAPAVPRYVVPDLADEASSALGGGAGSLQAYLGLAAAMGALSLLTPCVFPMVPITVSYFTGRASRGRGRPVRLALLYGAGIVLTFTGLGAALTAAFGASGLNQFAANPWLNLGVAALFVALALNLFGVFNVSLPSRFVNAAAAADRGRGEVAGTLLMGVAFTVTSFTCTAPFLGTLLVVAAEGDWRWPLAGLTVFAAVFALPFVGLALAPAAVARLPRSGPWLLSLKSVMGVLEIAAAMKFVSNADLVWSWGVVTREVVLVTWIVLAVVLVAHFAGGLALGHAGRPARLGLLRGALASLTAVAAIWLADGVRGRRLGELEAFLPPAAGYGTAAGELAWIVNDLDEARARAALERKPILVDFTGYTCTNCRWMEANMFPRPGVADALEPFVRVRLYTDGRDALHREFQRWQREAFGTVALPYYVALGPDGTPVVAFSGLTRDEAAFVAFLRRGRP